LNIVSWSLWISISVIGMLITGFVLNKELKERQNKTCKFTNYSLRCTSIVCLWTGLGVNLCQIIRILPGFCIMDGIAVAFVFYIQSMSLGLYQLSRLHYCFSRESVQSDKGYPYWAFTLMIIVGIILGFSWIVTFAIIDPHCSKCGFGGAAYPETFFVWTNERSPIILDGMYSFCVLVISIGFHIWDITTLMMYIYKIRTIGRFYKSKENGIWNNVLSILHRIVIITLFYQILGLLIAFLYFAVRRSSFMDNDNNIGLLIASGLTYTMLSTLYSLSVHLMMEHKHNIKAYIGFLEFLRRFYLNYLCFCCCRNIVDQQLEDLSKPQPGPIRKGRSDAHVNRQNHNLNQNALWTIDKMPTQTNISAGEPYSMEEIRRSFSTVTRMQSTRSDIFRVSTTRDQADVLNEVQGE